MRFRTKRFIIWGGLVLALSAGTLWPSLRTISGSFERAAVSNFSQMPTMDGFEATRQIREHEARSPHQPRLPIIALTANASGADRGRCMATGMDGYCGKPSEPMELLTMIGQFLAGTSPADPPSQASLEPRHPEPVEGGGSMSTDCSSGAAGNPPWRPRCSTSSTPRPVTRSFSCGDVWPI